jgi:hypothetical protein
LAVLDKGFLALALAIVAGLVKWLLQMDQAQRDLVKEIAPKRAEAYEKLWKVTEQLCRKKQLKMDMKYRKDMHNQFNKAYFDDGAAMYLSHEASSKFLKAKGYLVKNDIENAVLIEEVSNFRTQLKKDLKIYSKREAETPLDI